MSDNKITRLRPDGAVDGGMKPLNYIGDDTVIDGVADEKGHLFFTNEAGNVNAGVWECTPCTERIRNYPYDQCCFVLEGSLAITDESGTIETFGPGDSFIIPHGFNGDWTMTETYKNFFITIETVN